MYKNEQGSVIFLALLTIVVLMTMVTASMQMITNEIKINSYNEDKVKALYLAEAGVERALNIIKDDPDGFKLQDLPDKEQSLGKNGKYWYDYPGNNNPNGNIFTIYSFGKISGSTANRKIIVKIRVAKDAMIAGGKIKTQSFLVDIPKNKREQVGEGSLPNFDFDAYKEEVDDDKYFNNEDEFKTKYSDDKLASGTFYIDDKLEVKSVLDNLKGTDKDKPTVLIVNGNFQINSALTKIENIYLMVNGKVQVNVGGLKAENTFIYAEKKVHFNGVGFSCSGTIISRKNILLHGIGGEIIHEPVNTGVLPKGFPSTFGTAIISWEEK